MRKTIVGMLLLTCISLHAPAAGAAGVDPAQALADAKRSIAGKDFRAAVDVLRPALGSVDTVPESQRTQALAALHFYSAVAYTGLRNDADARTHLAEYLRLTPGGQRIDVSKFDPRFVALFTELSRTSSEGDSAFDALYPGFRSVHASVPVVERGTWGSSLGLLLLGSKAERRTWESLRAADARAQFIDDFWRRRDLDPATPENEFQLEFERRVAFADRVFTGNEARGAMSDRGKVFVLLGEPAFVRRRPLTSSDRVRLVEEAIDIVNGTMEHWVYSKEQLPAGSVTQPSVMFRFVTQQGIGDGVLQQDRALGKRVLSLARGIRDAE
jgi:GWxTD domain-containing protein